VFGYPYKKLEPNAILGDNNGVRSGIASRAKLSRTFHKTKRNKITYEKQK